MFIIAGSSNIYSTGEADNAKNQSQFSEQEDAMLAKLVPQADELHGKLARLEVRIQKMDVHYVGETLGIRLYMESPPNDALPILTKYDVRELVLFGNHHIKDYSPLIGMPINVLMLSGVTLRDKDLAIIAKLPLETFCWTSDSGDDVKSLSAFKECRTLKRLQVDGTYSDLTPLKELPISMLSLSNTNVRDISPLKNMKLTDLDIDSTAISDITALKGMPLSVFLAHFSQVVDLSPLKGAPLKRISIHNTQVADISPLKGMPLESFAANSTRVKDLTPLKGAPIERLEIERTDVSDISALRGMPLSRLDLAHTQIKDISVLEGMRIVSLQMHDTLIEDISILETLPLNYVSISKPLAEKNEVIVGRLRSKGVGVNVKP